MGHQIVPVSSWSGRLVPCQPGHAQSAVPTHLCLLGYAHPPGPTRTRWVICGKSSTPTQHAHSSMPTSLAHPSAQTLSHPRFCSYPSTPTWLWRVVPGPSNWPWVTLPCIFYNISSQLLEVFTASAGQIYFSLVTVQGLQKTQMLLWTKTATPSEALKSLFSLFP